jgi:hypothetical protein
LQSLWSRNDDAISVSGSAMGHPMHESDDEFFPPPSQELVSISLATVQLKSHKLDRNFSNK